MPRAPAAPCALLAVALLLPLALAGCSGGGKDGGAAPGPQGPAAQGPPGAEEAAALPTWAVRDWWTYSTQFGDATYVVTADQGGDWFVDTTNLDLAFADARDDISRLGPVRKSDLAGSQGSDRVQFFQWPLTHNKTWATRWDGVDVTVTAQAQGDGTFVLVARNATADMYRYIYDPQARWFRQLQRLGPDGTPDLTLGLTASGHDFTGEAARWHLTALYEGSASAGASLTAAQPFELPAGVHDLWLGYRFECPGGQGGYAVAIRAVDPPGAAYTANGQCTSNEHAGPVVDAPAAGTWAYAIDAGGNGGTFSATLLQRVLELVPVP